jgi:excisionase family DNA binding protein
MTTQTSQIGHLAPIAYTPEDAALVSGRSRSRVYEAIKNQELLARKDGRSTVIERDELIRWIRSMPCVIAA